LLADDGDQQPRLFSIAIGARGPLSQAFARREMKAAMAPALAKLNGRLTAISAFIQSATLKRIARIADPLPCFEHETRLMRQVNEWKERLENGQCYL
jgi:hypothetical protein